VIEISNYHQILSKNDPIGRISSTLQVAEFGGWQRSAEGATISQYQGGMDDGRWTMG